MAGRKDKNTVDYFPHYCVSGKTLFIIESKFSHTGYSVWFKTLELLGSSENHYIDLRNESDMLFLISKLKITEEQFTDIYNLLAKLDAIDSFLWGKKIVYSENFVKNINDAYKRRSNKCMHKLDLCEHLNIKCIQKPFKTIQESTEYSIVEESKEKETIQEEVVWTESNEEFKKFLCKKFGVNEVNQFQNYALIKRAISIKQNQGVEQYNWFKGQCFLYFLYKEKSKQTTHGLKSFIGELDEIDLGNWNAENWDKKYQALKQQDSTEPKANVQPKGHHRIGSPAAINQLIPKR